jgi:hypothetical protein
MPSIEKHRDDVQRKIQHVLQLAESDEARKFAEFERALWISMLALGRAVIGLFLARQVALPRSTDYASGGRRWKLGKHRSSKIGTRFGKVWFRRPTGRDIENPRAACDLPVDRELGLCAGFSLGVVTAMARLCAQMAFGNARDNFREVYEWAPSPRAILRMVDTVGGEARAFLEQAPAPDGDGEVLVIQVDAKGTPMISTVTYRRRSRPHKKETGTDRAARKAKRRRWPRKKRRTKGKKSKNAKMAVLGVIYTLRQTGQGMEGPINKQVIGTFESHRALFVWLRAEADKRGYGSKRTLFLADGCDHIWRLQQEFFPEAEACIDWCHIVEKLWTAGGCLYKEGSTELEAWVARQATRLRRGAIKAIINELKEAHKATPRTGPGNKGKRERLEQAMGYFTEHQARMRYAELRRDDLDIATGVAEGAVRNVVGVRLDGPGMHWGMKRAERILHLRCILVNGQWRAFVEYLEKREGFVLASQPEAAIPHDAKVKAA